MDNRISYTAVGLFVIGLGAALVLAFVWLATHGEDKTYLRYQVLTTESVSGLNRNASVTYRGVVVGRVASIGIDRDDPERVRGKLLKGFAEITGIRATPGHAVVHRWRYAQTQVPLGQAGLYDAALGVGLCGDWCLGHRVENAFVSGLSLALDVIGQARPRRA